MQLLTDKIKGAHAVALADFAKDYASTDRKTRIAAMSEMAAYCNKHFLATDIVCIACAGAELLARAVVAYFEQQQPPKKKRAAAAPAPENKDESSTVGE